MSNADNASAISSQVFAIRQFNRFYTAELGLLQRRYLDGEFSLTEARILFEIGEASSLTATQIGRRLRLDKGYLSRLLTSLTKRKLVSQHSSESDGRERTLTLTNVGHVKLAALNQQSVQKIESLLLPLTPADRGTLAEALSQVRALLCRAVQDKVRIVRLTTLSHDGQELLMEYLEAVGVVERDSVEAVQEIIRHDSSGMWVAYLDQKAVGCVMLRPLEKLSRSGECKRLYVRAHARGRGIASALLATMERHARQQGFDWVYLDSKDDLQEALVLYNKRGYEPCARYNNNPQATVFLRKALR